MNKMLSRVVKPSRCMLCLSRQSLCTTTSSQVTKQPEEAPSGGQYVVKTDKKPMTNIPFVKDLFLGRYDKNILVYPELDSNEELAELDALVRPVEKFFTEELDSRSIDENACIPEAVLQQLKDFGLFGQQIPEEYGGLGLNATKYARIAEITALDGAISVTLAAHQSIGLKGILIAGNEQQKQQYLPKLATGEHVAAFCLTEPSSGSDAASIQTKAKLSEDGKTYLLNGGKIWISNGGIADVFTVFAKVQTPDFEEGMVTAFIVERGFGGITNGKPEDKLGIRGSNTCEVHFENTPVPVENVLGEVGGGFKVAMNILNSGRFSMGSSVAGGLKRLLGEAIEHAITRSQFNKKLYEFGLIQEKFGKMATIIYAMESMSYLTAGQLDQYQQPDCSLEAAAVKVFSSEGCWYCVNEILQIFGGLGYMKDFKYERVIRDARILQIFEGTNEILRLYIALSGLQHAGKELQELVRKYRDPFNNFKFIWKEGKKRALDKTFKKPKLRWMISKNVHPTLSFIATDLERLAIQFQWAVEDAMYTYKNDVVEEQLILKKMSDIVIDIYALTACLARVSRSLGIGLRNADHEKMLTHTFAIDALARIDNNLKLLKAGKHACGDDLYRMITDDMCKNKGWAAEHPLKRNW